MIDQQQFITHVESALADQVVTFSLITSASGLFTKAIRPNVTGGIIKAPAAQMAAGIAETFTMPLPISDRSCGR